MKLTRRKLLASTGSLLGFSLLPRVSGATRKPARPDSKRPASPDVRPVSLLDYETLAQESVSKMAYAYVAGGAADEITVRWNREALDALRLRPRVLVDVAKVDTRVTLFGQELAFPVLLAPTAFHRLMHPEGERATARGARAAGATYVVSSATTTPIEDIARAGAGPLWFQLYVEADREFTKDLVARVQEAGCRALCVTVDTPVPGVRNRQERAGFKLPPGVKTPYLLDWTTRRGTGGLPKFESITWKDIEWLQSLSRVPVLLKGILNPDDAEIAVRNGVAGIIVSNHGGRNLDTAPATIAALPRVADRVAGRMPILMDGGIRRGTDVVKALALGAKAILIGRPYLYGLGAAGAEGVADVVHILRNEFEMALALMGTPAIPKIDRALIW